MQAPDIPDDADRSILAEGIDSIKLGYYGRDAGTNDTASDPSWRDHWDDNQRLPLLVRIDVKPKQGPPWPTLFVAPRTGPEAGCRAWDAGRQRCAGV